jgi:hypothetical protein
MLCSLCSGLDWHQILRSDIVPLDRKIDHHKSYADLSLAASQGCEFCTVAHIAVLDTHSLTKSLSVEDFVQRHLEQDRIESPQHEGLRGQFLLLRVETVSLDTRFSPYARGVTGIYYFRRSHVRDELRYWAYITLSAAEGMNIVLQPSFAYC